MPPGIPPRRSIVIQRQGVPVQARIAPLTPRWARGLIVYRWWIGNRAGREADEGFDWVEAARRAARDPEVYACYAALTGSAPGMLAIQGAIAYDFDGQSLIESGGGAVYARYLAAAPWNRFLLPGSEYRGVGRGLIRLAMLDSLLVGFGGRVILDPLRDSERFYESLGFQETAEPGRGRMLMEIPRDMAIANLRAEGWI